MSAGEPARARATGPLTPLPRLEDLPLVGEGIDRDRVSELFDQFRRHVLQLQAQLRVLQAAGSSGRVEPTGHAVRMDALYLIRAAAEFADQIERDAQPASAAQIGRTEEEVRRKQTELQARGTWLLEQSRHQAAELTNASRAEVEQTLEWSRAQARRTSRAPSRAPSSCLPRQARRPSTSSASSTRSSVRPRLPSSRAGPPTAATVATARSGRPETLAAS